MEYLKIENGIITRHLCGHMADKTGYVEVDAFYGFVGDRAEYYDENWHRKPLKQLIDEKLIEIPENHCLSDDGESFIPVDKTDNLSKFYIEEEGILRKKTPDELFADGLIKIEELCAYKRTERNERINAIQWQIERYRQQRDAGFETTDSEEWYQAVLKYVQALRDITQQEGFPVNIVWP